MTFVDAWAWIALADKSDQYHAQAKAQHRKFLRAKEPYVTSDYVLGEVITYLYDALPAVQAQSYVNTLLTAVDKGVYRLAHVTPQQFRRA